MASIVVLGMHRSGTSALVRALGLLGASLGPPDDLGEHWESKALRRVNERILELHGGAWDCPPELTGDWVGHSAAGEPGTLARAALAGFGASALMAWKDPRTCLTMPFWDRVLPERPVVVMIHRHPEEVARSLAARRDMVPGLAFALWERYNAAALAGAVGHRVHLVSYDRLLEAPAAILAELCTALARWGVALPNDPTTTDTELRSDLRHHEAPELLEHPSATEPQRELRARLRAMEGVHDDFALEQALPAPHPLSGELIEMERRLIGVRRDLRVTRTELRRLLGSRRELLGALGRRLVGGNPTTTLP